MDTDSDERSRDKERKRQKERQRRRRKKNDDPGGGDDDDDDEDDEDDDEDYDEDDPSDESEDDTEPSVAGNGAKGKKKSTTKSKTSMREGSKVKIPRIPKVEEGHTAMMKFHIDLVENMCTSSGNLEAKEIQFMGYILDFQGVDLEVSRSYRGFENMQSLCRKTTNALCAAFKNGDPSFWLELSRMRERGI